MERRRTVKVVVTSQGSDLNSQVDPRFGRAKNFIVVDTETDEFLVHDNTQNRGAAQGAGIQAGRAVVDLGVAAVITGNVGPKAFTTLQAGNVEVYPGASGTVKEAVEKFKAGQLKGAEKANVEGHWA
jgi:predicted Fe-Mo cluster-binding NifX family protein